MNKIRSFLIIIFILLTVKVFSQEVNFKIVSSKDYEIYIRVDFPEFKTTQVDVNGEIMNKLQMKGGYPVNEIGAPELLLTSTSLIIPEDANTTVELVESDDYEISDFDLVPSKGRLLRTIDPSTIPYQKGAQYQLDSLLPANPLFLRDPFILRDYQGISLICYPCQYNPTQKILKVYKSMLICVKFDKRNVQPEPQKITSEFNEIYKSEFINYQQTNYTPSIEEGDLLIIAPENYIPALSPLSNWKIKNGIHTEIIARETIGNTCALIRSYITNYYNSHNLAYVILAGDNSQIPSYILGGESCDNYYSEVAGSDNIPDILLGRISAETVAQVSTQVQKIIQYEQNPPESSHFARFCGIGSEEGPGDNNEYDYEHIRNIDNLLLNYHYSSGYEFFEGSQGGLDGAGDPTSTQVSNALNNGVGILNYCGHGSYNSFGTSGFSSGNINSLSNNNKLPFIISVACQNGDYANQTCFAESWMRANNNGESTGAIGVLMSSINQPWDPPMAGQDEINNVLTESISGNIKRRFGGIVFDGLLKMLEIYNDVETYRTWLIFGDPSLMLRTAIPQELSVNHLSNLPVGVTNISFTSPIEGSKIVLSCNNQILAQGYISNGSLNLAIPTTLTLQDTIQVLASKYNYIPYQGVISFIASGPYLVYDSHSFAEIIGNNNNFPDYGETVEMTLCLKNCGTESTNNILLTLRTSDPYISILDSTTSIAQINNGYSNCSNSTFKFHIANDIPFGHIVNFSIQLKYNNNTYYINLQQVIYTPNFEISDYVIDDSGSNVDINNQLDIAENCMIKIPLHNCGNSASRFGNISLTCLDGKLIIENLVNMIPVIGVDSEYTSSFRISVNPNVTEPSSTNVRVVYRYGLYSIIKDFTIPIGTTIEDWETGTFTKYEWENSSTYPWELTTLNCFEGTFSARSKEISNNQTSQLSISINVANPDSISFYYYVSCEEGNGSLYDRLEFYIDNTLQSYWDGETSWTRATFPVTAGNHTFYWKYIKDTYVAEGQDLAMIDYISLPQKVRETSIENFENVSVTIFPNPTSNYVNIDIKNCDFSIKQIEVLDVYGKLIKKESFSGNSGKIDMSNLSQGLYILIIREENNILNIHKIVKK